MPLAPARPPATRFYRTIAVALASWMVALLVLAAAHQAEVEHVRLTDGTVVHVDLGSAADAHAACQEHSASQTFDQHAPPVTPSDPCWICDVAQQATTSHPRFDFVARATEHTVLALAITRRPAPVAVLHLAPKTSPPV